MTLNAPHTNPAITKRWTICDHCMAAVEAGGEASSAKCVRCGEDTPVSPIDDQPLAARRREGQIGDHERFARLRKQDGKQLLPPPEIANLVDGGALAEWKVEEALQIWNGARRDLRAATDPAAERRLMFLNVVLSNHFSQKDPKLVKALRESALEVVALRSSKQELRGDLAREAAKRLQFAEAEAWLAPCDPLSDDLAMDSAYRHSRALVAWMQGDFNAVLTVLGPTRDEIPFAGQYDVITTVMRAGALENLGQVEEAAAQLAEAMSDGYARSIGEMVAKYADKYKWCRQSYPLAERQYGTAAARSMARARGGGVGGMLLFVGGIQLLIGLVLIVVGIVEEPEASIPGGVMAVVGLGLCRWGYKQRRAGKRTAYVRLNGQQAVGTVVKARTTGLRVNNIPQMAITLRVEVEGREPYEAVTKLLIAPQNTSILAVGKRLHLRVDPNDPQFVVLEAG